ncbi:MAG: DHH family phosphoesterase [Acidaminococcus sp.]|jgi:c-di-AMP phosphodiesterase-like protein|nr:DHH family phosphoesterase [Acidaminococcus sp.]MCI2114193.1 DHH family phosphoesterase [Acidaminococcus sp.]MCI2116128.1 DHH family phosphoesterase [Acidaminococcus sp.]
MKEKDRSHLWGTFRVVMAVLGSISAVYGLYANLALCTAAGFVIVLLVYYFSSRSSQLREAWFNHAMTTVVRNIERANNYAVQRLPIGIGVFDRDGHLQWRNRLFNEILSVDAPLGASFEKIMPAPENNFAALGVRDADKQLKVGDRIYTMLVRRVKTLEEQQEDTGVVIYLYDITDKERQQRRYEDERPVVAFVQFDNYSDAQKGLNESERANMVVAVTKAISAWAEEIHGYSIKYSEDLYLVGINKKGLMDTINRKFPVLDEVRKIKINSRTTPTISIGISCGGKTLAQMSQKAQSCLDLALGRGGDQAVVAMGEEVSFYGARGSVQAKNTRVRARIVAQAIHELMTNADKVFIMGHVNEDYDAIGAAIGVAKMARTLGKECYIISSGQGTAMANLKAMSKGEDDGSEYLNMVVDEDTALEQKTPGSLLVLVDHHRPMLTAAPKVLHAIKRRIIIDHHRRAEDAIEDVMLQYMEPSTSSTSEMVTEILQYFQNRMEVTSFEASVLYAGILVDTKNFAVQTGERTFEAAAFLRRNGADPHVVSQLFKEDEVSVVRRAKIITEMQKPLPGLALSIHHCSVKDRDESVIVAQAADELLTMNDVHVSAVISENEEGVSISARSDGTVNVQVMMEELGGGGHQTVAGVQIKGAHAQDLVPKIIEMAKDQMEKEDNKDESNSAAGREEVG